MERYWYSFDEMQTLMEELRRVFDVVRLVDPKTTCVMDDGTDGRDHRCYSIWGKEDRCSNCISLKVLQDHGKMVKTESIDGRDFTVISQYVQVDGEPYALEMVISAD